MSETKIHRAESDTTCLRIRLGQEVRVAAGPLEGLEGTVIGQRTAGRILIEVTVGVHMEIHQFCLESKG